jgi:hypothetical protein
MPLTQDASRPCHSAHIPGRPSNSDGSTTVLLAEPSRGSPVVLSNRRKPPVAHACEPAVRGAHDTRRDVLVPEKQPAERHQRRSGPPAQRHNNACSRPPCRGDFSSATMCQATCSRAWPSGGRRLTQTVGRLSASQRIHPRLMVDVRWFMGIMLTKTARQRNVIYANVIPFS